VDVRAAERASAAVAAYLASALRGRALDAGPCGAPEATAEGDYVELLRMARGALVRPSLLPSRGGGGGNGNGGGDDNEGISGVDSEDEEAEEEASAAEAREELVAAVGEVWQRAVAGGPPERRAACVSLLAAVLPAAASAHVRGGGGGGPDGTGHKVGDGRDVNGVANSTGTAVLSPHVAAVWLRPFARLLWELKHHDPSTTSRALHTLHAVAARMGSDAAAANGPLCAALAGVESELAPFFARVPPPPPTPETPRAPARPGPFSRLPGPCQAAAVMLLGSLPALSPATLRAAAHAVLAQGGDPALAVRAVESMACNLRAAPLALSVSFLATVLTGSPSWATAAVVAPAAGSALASLGDAGSPCVGASLAWPAAAVARTRALAVTDDDAARRAVFGMLVAAAAAAEAAAAAAAAVDTSAPEAFAATTSAAAALAPNDIEEALPNLIAETLATGGAGAQLAPLGSAAAAVAATAAATYGRGGGGGGSGATDGEVGGAVECAAVCSRLLHSTPRWTAPVLACLARGAAEAAEAATFATGHNQGPNNEDGAVECSTESKPTGGVAKRAKAVNRSAERAGDGGEVEDVEMDEEGDGDHEVGARAAAAVEGAAGAAGAVCAALPVAQVLAADAAGGAVRAALAALAAAADVLVAAGVPGAARAARAARVARLAAAAALGDVDNAVRR